MPTDIHTDNDHRDYHLRRVCGKTKSRKKVTFHVKCKNDAHIALLSGDSVNAPMIEVFIGGWGNTQSAIRLNQTKPDKVHIDTPNIVDDDDYKTFWIKWIDNHIKVGVAGQAAPFMDWENTEDPFKIKFLGFTTGWGSSGHWRLLDEGESSDSD